MSSETLICQNCKQDFVIDDSDKLFYQKMQVPAPTFCPSCSHQRRFAWRNTHSLYRRKCAITGKDILSIYSPDKNLNVIDQHVWWGDSWSPLDYGREYDFSKPFFTQWREMRDVIPLQSLSNSKAVNSDYCNVAEESFDSYLASASWKIERTLYSDSISQVKDTSDVYVAHRSEFLYDSIYCSDSYRVLYSEKVYNSTDSYFLYDCRSCIDCFMCSNLRNKSYCFENQQLTKEAYFEKMKSLKLDSYSEVQKYKKQFEEMKFNAIHRYANIINSHNVSGDNIERGENSYYVFDGAQGIKDSKHVFWVAINVEQAYNSGPGIGMGNCVYELIDGGAGGGNIKFGNVIYYSTEVEYSFNCYNCVNCFGCIGLRNKKYCILNKEYSKEEYFLLVAKIKQHMMDMPYVDKTGLVYKYGEFFPIELSPFCYNETIADAFYPMTREQILERGFGYKDKDERLYHPTINSTDLPDIYDFENDDQILKEIIACEHPDKSFDRCSTAFRLVKDELLLYKRLGIPLPRACYQCRHYERFKKRHPLNLWKRQCMCEFAGHDHAGECPNTFDTSYTPERSEKVYCESCYQKEVL